MATAMLEDNDLNAWMRKNNRAAVRHALVQLFEVLFLTCNFHSSDDKANPQQKVSASMKKPLVPIKRKNTSHISYKVIIME